MKYNIIKLEECEKLIEQASEWFHKKWGIPQVAYWESMKESVSNVDTVPKWYIIMDGKEIIAGLGVIENDFHDRKDLAPNICAVYVEKEYRNKGIAGELLQFVCKDFKSKGIKTLYLITDHIAFYERYGWEFLCMVQGNGEAQMTRMYIHKEQ